MSQPAPQPVKPEGSSDLTGSTVGRFVIRARLGAGGMGEVYRAEDTRLKRPVALKRIAPRLQSDPAFRQQFLREAQLASELTSQNIAGVYDVFETGDEMYVVMEYVEGATLREKMAEPLSIEKFLGVAMQCAAALTAAHERGVVHSDIKPENIMLTPSGQVKILDFGVAKRLPHAVDAATLDTLGSHAGSFGGTLAYMAPEALLEKEPDHRVDIFSLGAVFYEILAGQHPFRAESFLATTTRILHEVPAPLRESNAKVPAELERIVAKMLAKNPAERYATAADLLVDLRAVERGATAPTHPSPILPVATTAPRGVLRWSWAASVVFAVFLLLAGLNVGGLRDRLLGWKGSLRIESIAVLPLENLSHDPEQDYFADGMTDALITELSSVGALRVVSRTSVMRYKGARKPLSDIARELNVDAVVEGTVLRSGGKVRISAKLIQAAADRQIWSRSYERDMSSILALQSEVAQTITREINVKLTPQEQARLTGARRPVNPEAYEAYLKGRFAWNKRTEEGFLSAIQFFEQAIAKDSQYAAPHAGLADSYSSLGSYHFLAPEEAMPKAKAAAMKALALDGSLAEAHASLGYINMLSLELSGAEEEFKRAIELNPGYDTARHWHALFLAAMGRSDAAITEINVARKLSPLSLIISANVGWCHYLARQFDEAVRETQGVLELDTRFPVAHGYLGQSYVELGRYEEAIAEFQKAIELSAGNAPYKAELANAYAAAGRTQDATKLLRELNALSRSSYVSPYDLALVYMGLGKKAEALSSLERAYVERDGRLVNLNVHPRFDGLRTDPRFQKLLARIGFPARPAAD